MTQGSVIITGASRGIGRATALLLDNQGYRVFAGVRKPQDGDALRAEASDRLQPVTLDLLDVASLRKSMDDIGQQLDNVGLVGLINNAGLAVNAPVEFIPLEDLRYQFEVNLFGTIALTQACIPLLRKGQGRIINISSIAGRLTSPLTGAYSASKFALEAMTDALRMELMPWGIRVVSVQPGAIATDFGANVMSQVDAMRGRMSDEVERLYGRMMAVSKAQAAQNTGIPPSHVAATILRALEAPNPRTRYLVGSDARMIAFLRAILPDKLADRVTLAVTQRMP